MKCAIIDSTESRCRSLVRQIAALGHDVYSFRGRWDQVPPSVDVTLFHAGDKGYWDLVKDVSGIGNRVVWFSGAGVADDSKLSPAGRGIPRKIEASGDASPSEWRELLDFMASGASATADKPLPRLLQASGPSVLIALSILCQGYLMARDPAFRGQLSQEVGSGVLKREDWWAKPFAPLGGKILARARAEWGSGGLDKAVESLIMWIEKGPEVGEAPGEVALAELDHRVKSAKASLDSYLLGEGGHPQAQT